MLVPLLTLFTCQLVASTLPYMQIEYGDPTTYRFGYDIGHVPGAPRLLREETKQPDGSIIGRYGYTDPYGNFREVRYIAGDKGFVITQDKTVPDPSKSPSPPSGSQQPSAVDAPSAEFKEQIKRPVYSSQEHLAEKAIPDDLLASGIPFASHFTDEGSVPRPPFYQFPGLSRNPDSSESFIASGLPFASFHPAELSDHHSLYEPKDAFSPQPQTTERPRPVSRKPASQPPNPQSHSARPSPTAAPSTLSPPEPTPEVVFTGGSLEYHPYDYLSGKPTVPQTFLSSGIPFASSLEQVNSGHQRPPVAHGHHKESSLHYHQLGQKETPESIFASSLPFASFKVQPKTEDEEQEKDIPQQKQQSEVVQPFDPVSGKAVIPESFLASSLPFASSVSDTKQPAQAPLYHASDHLAQKQVLPSELLASGLPLASFGRPSQDKSPEKPSHDERSGAHKPQDQVVDPVHGQVHIPESYLASGLPFASSPTGVQRSYNLGAPRMPFLNLQDRYSHDSELAGSYLASGLPFASFRPGGGRAGGLSKIPGSVQDGREDSALPEELLASGLPFASSLSKFHQTASSPSGGRIHGSGQRTVESSRVYDPSHTYSSYQRPSHSILPAKPYGFQQKFSGPQRRIALIQPGEPNSQTQTPGKSPKSADSTGASFVSIAESNQKDNTSGRQTALDPAQPNKAENPSL